MDKKDIIYDVIVIWSHNTYLKVSQPKVHLYFPSRRQLERYWRWLWGRDNNLITIWRRRRSHQLGMSWRTTQKNEVSPLFIINLFVFAFCQLSDKLKPVEEVFLSSFHFSSSCFDRQEEDHFQQTFFSKPFLFVSESAKIKSLTSTLVW